MQEGMKEREGRKSCERCHWRKKMERQSGITARRGGADEGAVQAGTQVEVREREIRHSPPSRLLWDMSVQQVSSTLVGKRPSSRCLPSPHTPTQNTHPGILSSPRASPSIYSRLRSLDQQTWRRFSVGSPRQPMACSTLLLAR